MTTCGLMNVGAPAADSAVSGRGLHGRIGNTPARNLQVSQEWHGNDYVLRLTGTMRETSLFGENLTLRRTVSTKLGATNLAIEDVVTNEGFEPVDFQLLYHCNIGWPAVDADSRLIAPSRRIAPRDAIARDGQENWNVMQAPTHGYAEKVYYHDMAESVDGTVTVAVANPGLARGTGFGIYLRYRKAELPRFTQWKMMGEQAYVLGLEPCNCGVEGRAADEALGLLETLEAGASKTVRLEFGAIARSEELEAIEAECGEPDVRFVDSYKEFTK